MKRPLHALTLALVGLSPAAALANVDPACDVDGDGNTDDFDPALTSPAAQEWNLASATAISLASSPLTSPAPYKLFQVAVGADAHQFQYMTCQERTVFLGSTQKTEDTNKTPVVPRLRVSLGLPFSYVSISGVPPVRLFGVRTGVITGEVGAGYRIPVARIKPGIRLHATGGQVVGDIAHPIGHDPGDADYDDFAVDDEYQFLDYGADLSVAWEAPLPAVDLAPYVGVGFLSVSSIFYVGEDAYTVFTGDAFLRYLHEENPGPEGGPYPGYRGLDAFLGVRVALLGHVEGAVEGFFIPVRMALGADDRFDTDSGGRSAYVTNYFSVRARAAYLF